VTLPREAREGISQVWLEILREKHPGVSWVLAPADGLEHEQQPATTDDLVVAA
jgi:hypothetical protein